MLALRPRRHRIVPDRVRFFDTASLPNVMLSARARFSRLLPVSQGPDSDGRIEGQCVAAKMAAKSYFDKNDQRLL